MIKDITLGQYFPGNSLLHRLDPRMKIILTVLFIVLVFLAKSAVSYALLLAFVITLLFVSKLPLKPVLRGLKPILFVILFTAVINIFFTKGDTVLLNLKIVTIYFEGVLFAVYMLVRIVTLVMGTSILLTYTTSPIDMTDGIEQLLAPLKKIKLPVHEFSMMMSIALRFIPTLIEETDKIMNAQKARGANFTSGSILRRAKALIPVLIPLFVSSIRRADDLATAMECRCYRGGTGRTRMKSLKYSVSDFMMLLFLVLFCALVIFVNIKLPVLVV
ncbi:MAG: energy-coupling factor transporter transmembrane protein EcfT [Clostridia bacterium]|nr:energy-coupling factor transporter transmembrane protein EcfT [Clostridia bacterium]